MTSFAYQNLNPGQDTRAKQTRNFAYRQRLKISHLAYLYGQSLGEWATQLVYM